MKLVRILILILLPLIAGSISGCAAVTHAAAASKAEATAAPPPPPGAALPSEELWIIAKDQTVQQPAQSNDALPGAGTLLARLADQSTLVPVPLKHTDVKADI